ncbi:MAG: L-histidine N(alpha)-methyltransferase [Pseudonocardia sp.]
MTSRSARHEILAVDDESAFWDDRSAVLRCLAETPPRIPAWYGYDAHGAQLWEELSELPSYYLTRAEFGLLERHADEVAARLGPYLAELGSGSAKKTRLLLAACVRQRATTYLPVDVTREMIENSATGLTAALDGLTVQGLWGRYEAGLAHLRAHRPGPLAVVFLGSNIGNLTEPERAALVSDIASSLQPGDRFLVTADLLKPAPVFEEAYNDPPGATAQARFRLNQLAHFSRRFDGAVQLSRFYARAHYVPQTTTVEGHLWATEDQAIRLRDLGRTITLRRGESICHGHSVKFHRPEFVDAVCGHGFAPEAEWIDPVWQYGMFLFTRR